MKGQCFYALASWLNMDDRACTHFLQWALPKLSMRWKGFRKVRRQVCRRLEKRFKEIKIRNTDDYRKYLRQHPDEWSILDRMCRITISRFYRNSVVFDYFASDVFPSLIKRFRSRGYPTLRVWSAGCASGEEPYTIALLWHFMFQSLYPDFKLEIIATDIDPVVIRRAEEGCYGTSSFRELPPEWLAMAFDRSGESYCLKERLKEYVRFVLLDIRDGAPGGMFHVILCRNLAFTYFDLEMQQKVLRTICHATEHQGVLITGTHEVIEIKGSCFVPWVEHVPIFQKI